MASPCIGRVVSPTDDKYRVMDIKVLYEDGHVMAINKPAGLVVHPDGKTLEPTLIDWILLRYPSAQEVGEPLRLSSGKVIHRPGIVHRLDRDTSGVMLIAKTPEGFADLKRQFQNREIEKIYHAFVHGELKDDEGVIDRPIGRSRSDFRRFSAERGARGKLREATTFYRMLGRGSGLSFVEITPKTGRTHQVRAHFKAINHPIIGDRLYAPKREKELEFNRLALHSWRISFRTLDGRDVTVEAPYPSDFEHAVHLLGHDQTSSKL